jgi:hypothetical protein
MHQKSNDFEGVIFTVKPAGTSFGPESSQLELGHAANLDSGQKHPGMTARGLCKSPSRDPFSEQLLMPLHGT